MAKKFPEDFVKDIEANKQAALWEIGLLVTKAARKLCPVDSGELRSSINPSVIDDTVWVGSNVKYAPFIEYGVPPHVVEPKDKKGKKRKPYFTMGIPVGTVEAPIKSKSGVGYRPFLRPAVHMNLPEIEKIISGTLLNFEQSGRKPNRR